jgi:hypothetical protein
MKWISSAGGPLVLVPTSVLYYWNESSPQNGCATDYDVACSVDDYIGVVLWRQVHVLVLDDEPHQTAFWRDSQGVLFVRWMYAPDEASVTEHLKGIRSRLLDPVEVVDFQVNEQEHVLLDAAAKGSHPNELLRVRIDPGNYRVTTHLDKPTKQLGLLIHVFKRADR